VHSADGHAKRDERAVKFLKAATKKGRTVVVVV
jgi:hypothetical protein